MQSFLVSPTIKSMQPELSVVVPCYNEEQNIRLGALDKVLLYLEKQTYSWEVLIVDDGSIDESRNLIKEFIRKNDHGFTLIENSHQGKAGAVATGMLAAKGVNILFADLDQATPIDQVEKLLPWFVKGYDIVIGSRKNRRAGAPLLRRLMGPGFTFVRSLFLGLKIIDTQCGFKMFTQMAAHDVFNKLKLYGTHKNTSGPRVTAGFDVEVLFIAAKQGYKLKEVPVDWHYVDTRRVSPMMDSLDALIDIIKIRLNSWLGVYGKN